MTEIVQIDTDQEMVFRTKKLGWMFMAWAIFFVAFGGTCAVLAWQDGATFMVVIGAMLFTGGLLMGYGLIYQRSRPIQDVMTLSPAGLCLHHGYVGRVAWDDVTNADQTILSSRAATQFLKLSFKPGTIDRLEMSKSAKFARQIDEAMGSESLMFAETHLDRPVHEALGLVELYRLTHSTGSNADPV